VVAHELSLRSRNCSENKQLLLQELQPNDYLRQHLQSFSSIPYLPIDLDLPQGRYCLYLLSDEDYFILSNYTIPIQASTGFFTAFYLQIETVELPKLYLSLKSFFGKSSRWFDDYKSSFAFPLFTEIIKPNATYNYIIIVKDYKGGLDFSIHRCVEEKIEPRQSVYHDPYEQEFSLEKIRYFISYFCGYLLGRLEILDQDQIMPFYYDIPSNHLFYGYSEQEGYFQF